MQILRLPKTTTAPVTVCACCGNIVDAGDMASAEDFPEWKIARANDAFGGPVCTNCLDALMWCASCDGPIRAGMEWEFDARENEATCTFPCASELSRGRA